MGGERREQHLEGTWCAPKGLPEEGKEAEAGGGSLSVSLGLPEKPSGIRFSRICLLQRGESLGYPQTICGEFETVDRKAPVLLLPIGMQDLGFRWPLLSWM